MPILKNAKYEAFARSLASGKSATEAMRDAGYSDPRNSTRLTKNDEIQRRVDELKGKVAKKVEVTIESLAIELEEARGIAITERQTSAAVSATMGKAKLFGLGVERKHHSGTIQVVTITAKHLDGLSEDELALLETAYPVLQKLGLIGSDSGPASEEGSTDSP